MWPESIIQGQCVIGLAHSIFDMLTLYFSFIKTLSGFEPLSCTSLLDCRPALQPTELLKSSKDWVSRGVLIPLFYGTGFSKFEDNSTPWAAGLQSRRLVQGKGSNLLKALIKKK